jgi:transcription elongation factor SPT6
MMLNAESKHLVTVSITIPSDVKQDFQNRLTEAISSDSFSDIAKAWNEERSHVVQEAIKKHLLSVGVKFAREYLRE